jgi:hypothetical protein
MWAVSYITPAVPIDFTFRVLVPVLIAVPGLIGALAGIAETCRAQTRWIRRPPRNQFWCVVQIGLNRPESALTDSELQRRRLCDVTRLQVVQNLPVEVTV